MGAPGQSLVLVLLMQGMGVSDELFPSFGLSFLICEMKSSDSKERQPAGLELDCLGSVLAPKPHQTNPMVRHFNNTRCDMVCSVEMFWLCQSLAV